jgi:copper homeostasis protein (lipoprotein)
MLHNRAMRVAAWPFIAFMLSAAAGCGRAPVPLRAIADGDGRVEWHGTAACADCERIDTRLALEREGDARRYSLIETYVAGEAGARFVERGQWRQDAALLHLAGSNGSRRTYALLDDGRLQARDSHGRRLQVRDDALLSPVAP